MLRKMLKASNSIPPINALRNGSPTSSSPLLRMKWLEVNDLLQRLVGHDPKAATVFVVGTLTALQALVGDTSPPPRIDKAP